MSELQSIGLLQSGAAGVVLLVVWMVLTGRLVPRSTHQDIIRERDAWRQAHAESEDARHSEREQNRDLIEVAHLAGRFFGSLPPVGEVTDRAPLDRTSTGPSAS